MNWNLIVPSMSMKKLKNYLSLTSLFPKEGKRRDMITLMLELRKNQKINNLKFRTLFLFCCYFKVLNLVVFCCFHNII